MDRGLRRMIGYKYLEVSPGQWGWAPTGNEESVDRSREIAFAIADGDLWPADEDTATWASAVTRKPVNFDPLFGSDK